MGHSLSTQTVLYKHVRNYAYGIGRDASTLAHKIKAAQYVRKNPGEVCPAKWEEGAKTLQPGLDLVGKI